MNQSVDVFKLYLSDTGLFVTAVFKDKDFTENIIYEKLLSDKLPANLGYVYENVVAQILRCSGYELYYYTMRSDTSNYYYEIDFLITKGSKISPIEVKSSGYKTHKSLDVFSEKFSNRIQDKYLVSIEPFLSVSFYFQIRYINVHFRDCQRFTSVTDKVLLLRLALHYNQNCNRFILKIFQNNPCL